MKPLENLIEKHGLEKWHLRLLTYTMLPKALRPSRQEICGELGISQDIYYYWLRDPRFNEARKQFIKQYYFDDLPDVLYALKNESISGNERAIRLFLEFIADFKKDDDRQSEFQPPQTLPQQEINIIINNLEQKFYGKSRTNSTIEVEPEPNV